MRFRSNKPNSDEKAMQVARSILELEHAPEKNKIQIDKLRLEFERLTGGNPYR